MPRTPRKLGRPPRHPGVTLSITSVSLNPETRLKGQERARTLGITFSALVEQALERECGLSIDGHPRSNAFRPMRPGTKIPIDENLPERCPNCEADKYAGYDYRERSIFCARCNTAAYIPSAVHLRVEGAMIAFDADDPTAR